MRNACNEPTSDIELTGGGTLQGLQSALLGASKLYLVVLVAGGSGGKERRGCFVTVPFAPIRRSWDATSAVVPQKSSFIGVLKPSGSILAKIAPDGEHGGSGRLVSWMTSCFFCTFLALVAPPDDASTGVAQMRCLHSIQIWYPLGASARRTH